MATKLIRFKVELSHPIFIDGVEQGVAEKVVEIEVDVQALIDGASIQISGPIYLQKSTT